MLIVGAGRAAEALVRDLRRSGAYQPVGFVDDAGHLHGAKLQGLPILGRIDEAGAIAKETAAKLLVIAIPSLDAAGMQRVVAICESTGLPFRTVPRLLDVLEGHYLPGELKEVAIEDLLGRKPVTPDWKLIKGWLSGRTRAGHRRRRLDRARNCAGSARVMARARSCCWRSTNWR